MSSLRRRLASSARWSVAIRLVERLIGFGSTLILVRLLAPVDFGVVAMGTAILEILNAVTAFGFTQALIRMPRRAHDAYSTAFTAERHHRCGDRFDLGRVDSVCAALVQRRPCDARSHRFGFQQPG